MIEILFLIAPLLFLDFSSLSKVFKSRSHKKGSSVTLNLFLLLLGVFYVQFLLKYIFLIDVTISAFIAWVLPVILLVKGITASMSKSKSSWIYFIFFFILLIVIIIFPKTQYKTLSELPDVQITDKKLEQIPIDKVIPVGRKTAFDKAQSKISSTAYVINKGKMSIVEVKNQLYWAAPMQYSGMKNGWFFGALKAQPIPGYILVSAEDKDAQAILVDGFKMKYVPSGAWGENIYRVVRKKYPDKIFCGLSFEPNESKVPYYVLSYGHKNKFRTGIVVDGVFIINPQTGEIKDYPKNKIPTWVDQVYDPELTFDYLKYFGKYKKGFFASLGSEASLHQPTRWSNEDSDFNADEVIMIYSEGKLKYFTDHTTLNEAKTMVGYSLMDARTGKITYHSNVKGFKNGEAIIEKINDTYVKFKGYNPVIYNIYGREAWVASVITNNGEIKYIAVADAQDGEFVVGKNKREAFENFKQMLARKQLGDKDQATDIFDIKEIEGNVVRINTGEYVKVLLNNSDKVFKIEVNAFPFSVFIEKGDLLKIKYIDTDESVVTVTDIKNKTLGK